MPNPRLASRYAQSLLDIAQEQNLTKEVLEDMKVIQQTVTDSRELELFLSSPIIKADKKSAVMTEVFSGKVNALTLKFIQLLINKGRESNLFEITQKFQDLNRELNKIKTIKVTTAVPMTDEVRQQVISKAGALVSGYTVETEETIDPEIIGGFIIEVDDKLYDSSVRKELSNIKKQFLSNSYIAEM